MFNGNLEKKVIINSIDINYEIIHPNADIWLTINATSILQSAKKGFITIILTKGEDNEKIVMSHLFEPGENSIDAVINIKDVELWWPHGIGDYSCYDLMVGIECDSAYQDVNQRIIGVCEREIKYSGEVEYATINEQMVFIKACKINSDLSGMSINSLDKIKSANFNSVIVSDINSETKLDYCTSIGLLVFEAKELVCHDISESLAEIDDDIDHLIEHACGNWCSNIEYRAFYDIYIGRQLSWLIQQSRILKDTGIISINYDDVFSSNVEFYVKRALADTRLIYFYYGSNVSIYYVNDSNQAKHNVTFKLGVLDLTTNTIKNQILDTTLEPMTAKKLIQMNDITSLLHNTKTEVLTALLLDSDKKQIARSTFFATNPKDIHFTEPEIFVSKFKTDNDEWRLALTTKGYARCLEISGFEEGVTISDNYFDLMPNEAKEVILKGSSKKPDITLRTWNR